MAKNIRRPYRPVVRKEDEHRINEKIRGVAEVRVVGDNVEVGVFAFDKALAMAKELNLDLVEIVPNSMPPVARIVDYSKFKYDLKKKQKELKAKQTKTIIKEIRFGPQTDDHDFEFKLKHAENFLKENSKVKAYVQFIGRQIVFKDQGFKLLEKFISALEDFGKPEVPPKLEGKRLNVIIAPKPKK